MRPTAPTPPSQPTAAIRAPSPLWAGQCAGATTTTASRMRRDGTDTAISGGTFHSCALDAGGRAVCWGDNGTNRKMSVEPT